MDEIRKVTDKKLVDLEKELNKVYATSQKELTEKWNAYMQKSQKAIEGKAKALEQAMKSGVADEIKTAEESYKKALLNQTLNNTHYKAMVDSVTSKMADVNIKASDVINDKMPEMYTINYNAGDDIASQMGIRFDIVNERAVKNLAERGEINLPKRKLDIPKDKRWNTKQMNSAVMQGIIQGESMDKISDRLLPIVDKNENSAIRAARTMTTEAENCGRLDSFKELEKEGAVLKKIWEATADDRVRKSHQDIDGEEQDIDKEFSNGCMYPGDGNGPAEEVWMCRCAMGVNIIGFRKEDGSINHIDYAGEPAESKDISFDEQEWRDELRQNTEEEFLAYGDEWLEKISESEKAGVVTYTSNAYREMNGYLRGSDRYKTTKYEAEIKECQKALKKASMPKDVITNRGGGRRGFSSLFQDENAYQRIRDGDAKWVEGLLVKDKGFMSTTPFNTGGYDVQYIIKIPKGANAAYVDKISKYQGERELLLAKDSEFYIHKAEYKHSRVIVFMSLL